MTFNYHKIVKYFALAFAAFIIMSIISFLMLLFRWVSGTPEKDYNKPNTSSTKEVFNTDFNSLNINLKASDIEITGGDVFTISTDNKYIKTKLIGTTFTIKEEKGRFRHWDNNYPVVVTIPDDIVFTQIKINLGASKMTINKSITTEKFIFNSGVGNSIINELNVTNNAKISSGVGKLEINDTLINNGDFNIGVGQFTYKGVINGDSKINAGIGNISLNLTNSIDEYSLHVKKGLGTIKINNDTVISDTVIWSGNNSLKVNGGIGTINIDFPEIQ